MAKVHSAKWFDRWEAKIREPVKNTKRYYYRKDLIKICTVVLLPWGLYNLIQLRKYFNNCIRLSVDCLSKGRTITNDGTPGAGKTFLGSNMAYFLAKSNWEKLKLDYHTYSAMRSEWVAQGDTDKLAMLKDIEESYLFFSEREDKYIPCLLSSLPLREYDTGRTSYMLEPGMLLQQVKCPEYCVLFHDESGRLFGSETSKTPNEDIKDFWRFIRHFLDAEAINTNQDSSQNAIYMRRSTDYINHLYGQEWDMKPEKELKRFDRAVQRLYRRQERGRISSERAEYLWQKLYYRGKYLKTIGFRLIKYRMTTRDGIPVSDMDYYVLPAIGGVEYDDRCYRNLYLCKDEPLNIRSWERLVVDEVDFRRDMYESQIK